MVNKEWWRGACIYQIYPRSFLDTNNDGIGDLAGITQKLDYIVNLGIDAIWISPFFKSPMKDFGYDISDYRAIDPIFGDMDDFDRLLREAHKKNLKIIIDLVLSHTSDQHPWFTDKSKKDWYVWANPNKKDGGPPNNWVSVFGGSAWQWCDKHKQYYLHNFLKQQPDLNFHNANVQTEILNTCKYWLDKGVDGLRLDVVNFYFHDQKLRNNPPRAQHQGYATQFEGDTPYSSQSHIYDKSRPEMFAFLKKLRKLTDQYEERVLIGEIGDDDPYNLARNYTKGGELLHTTYNPHMMSGVQKDLKEDLVRKPIEEFFCQEKEQPCGWPSWAFSNHDVVRAASRWYKQPFDHDPRLSKLLITLLGCLPGTIFLYQGEELGLPETKIPYEKLQDPWAKETWPTWQGRDGCRTPMPWNAERNNGFSTIEPWLPANPLHHALNVREQEATKASTLSWTRAFLSWRKKRPEILYGDFTFNKTNNNKIIDLTRKNREYETNCIFNLSNRKTRYKKHTLEPYSFYIDGLSNQEV